MIIDKKLKLLNGTEIPLLGLGTWLLNDRQAEKAIAWAVEDGYRHIDSAEAYKNEAGVGKAVRACGLPRSEIFVTSKVEAEFKTYERAKRAIDESLRRSGLDYLDLMLIHCPQPWKEYKVNQYRYEKENLAVWRAMEEAYEEGKLKSIGVSNFEIDDLNNIIANAKIKPMVNQALCHIRNTPFELIEFCKKEGIVFEAYSPIGHGEILSDPDIKAIADKHGVSVAQLCIRYCLELGLVVLPKGSSYEHIKENSLVDFSIGEEDMNSLKSFSKISSYGRSGKYKAFDLS